MQDKDNLRLAAKRENPYEKHYEEFLEVMNLGMGLRQDQLSGHSDKSGVEVLKDWVDKKSKKI